MSDFLSQLGKVDWRKNLLNALPPMVRGPIQTGMGLANMAQGNIPAAMDNVIESGAAGLEMLPYGGRGGRVAGKLGKAAVKKAALSRKLKGR